MAFSLPLTLGREGEAAGVPLGAPGRGSSQWRRLTLAAKPGSGYVGAYIKWQLHQGFSKLRRARCRPWGSEESDTTRRLNKLRKVHVALFSVRPQGLKADPNFVDSGREGQV